jgi:hypothetical protein
LLGPWIGSQVICIDLIFSVPLQRGGGIEIFVNFAGGAGQVCLIAAGGDGAKFIQRQLRVIGVEFFPKLADRLVKAARRPADRAPWRIRLSADNACGPTARPSPIKHKIVHFFMPVVPFFAC